MNEQMMQMMGGMPQQPQKEGTSLKSMLSEYRKVYGLVRDAAEKKTQSNPWAQEFQIPQGEVGPAWGSRVDLPEELPNYRDDRDSGDVGINQQEYDNYLTQHPFTQQYGGDMEKIIQKLSEMVKDESNPMTLEDAQRYFVENFNKLYEGWERGEDAFADERNDDEEDE